MKIMTPRPHQRDAIRDAVNVLRTEDRATVLMACATGKTLVGMWVAEAMEPKWAIVFVPSIALIQQVMREWLGATRMKGASWISVCSDSSVSAGEDAIRFSVSDLDFPASTSPAEVRRFLDSESTGVKLVFCTYDSAAIVGEAMRRGERFDIGVFDEAHKTAGRVGRKYSFALSDKNVKIKKRLFMTATPRHYNASKRNKDGEMEEVFSMDSRETYGPVAHELSYRKAVDLGLAVRFKIIFSVVTSRDLKAKRLKNGHVVIDGREMPAELAAGKVALLHAMKRTKVKKVFSFHDRVSTAENFADIIRSKSVGAHHVSGQMSASDRTAELDAFSKALKAVITNARCLTEGVDMPAVSMVAFMYPRRSHVDIVQAVGRAVRTAPGKHAGYVFIHLLVEVHKGESREQAIKRKRFDMVFDVLEALKESDSVLADKIRLIAQELGETGRVADGCLSDFVSVVGAGIDFRDIERGIMTRIAKEMSASWDVRYGQLAAYKKKHGNTMVPHTGGLGFWVLKQRQDYRSKRLSRNRIERLDELGFSWSPFDEEWTRMFLKFKKYVEKHGSSDVISTHPELGGWVLHQRAKYRRGLLRDDRVVSLEELGIVWDIKHDALWNKIFTSLEKYKSTGGDINASGIGELRRWVSVQRHKFNSGALSKDRIARLEKLGVIWNPIAAYWDENYKKLKKYMEMHGNINVPYRYDGDRKLAQWLIIQRTKYRSGTMPRDRVYLLEKLGMVWNFSDENWNKNLEELKKYKSKHGHMRIPRDQFLSRWINEQKGRRADGSLPNDRIEKLDGIGFIWSAHEHLWNKMFTMLEVFHSRHGNSDVPFFPRKSRSPDKKLSAWVRDQRRLHHSNLLNQERVSRLNKLKFTWDVFGAEWDAMFARLEEYKNKNGNANVPFSDESVDIAFRKWASVQRTGYRLGTLKKDRADRLKKIGFSWSLRKRDRLKS
jgi:superfamily II DNA or RNA helicase